jgi:ATP-dependent helicase/nuclease subunit A
MAVSASAGSGKTTVLVERFIRILLENPGIDIRSVVAITFTNKAAAEMLRRITEEVEKRLLKAAPGSADKRNLDRIRQKLTAARISTIHGFCSSLLRDYPVEAGIAPGFGIITEGESARLRRQCIRLALEEHLQSDDDKIQTLSLFRDYGKNTVQNTLEYLLQAKKEILPDIISYYQSHHDEEILQDISGRIIETVLPEWKKTLSILLDTGQLLQQYIPEQNQSAKKTKSMATLIQNMPVARAALQDILEQLHSIPPQSPMYRHLCILLESMNRAWNFIYLFYKGTDKAEPRIQGLTQDLQNILPSFLPGIQKAFDQLKPFSKKNGSKCIMALQYGDMHIQQEYQAIYSGRILAGIAHRAADLFSAAKRKQNLLDPDDMQFLALQLLEIPDIRKRVRAGLRYLMIDEFQDTNFRQYELTRHLVKALNEDASAQDSVNLYIVGDGKQSIYGFRSADVRVFTQAKQDIKNANHNSGMAQLAYTLPDNSLTGNESERHGLISLSVTFRLLPGIVAFVNKVHTSIMPPKAKGYEVEYEPMICARYPQGVYQSPMPGKISILLAPRKSAGKTQKTIDIHQPDEADLLADTIQQILSTEQKLSWDESAQTHISKPLEFKDIAILFARRTRLAPLLAALRARNIPCIVHGGSGFYNSTEITDFRIYLSFLHTPSNSIACAALLRSPFFSISDDDMLKAAQCKGTHFWEKFCSYAGSVQEAQNTPNQWLIQRAVSILTELIPLAQRISLPILLHLMMDKSAWTLYAAKQPQGKQMLANAEKLLAIARHTEGQGFRNLHDFVEDLERAAQEDDKEPEAMPDPNANAVNLMTIHASKGLEFPVIALYDSNPSKAGSTDRNIPVNMNGIGLPAIRTLVAVGAHEMGPSVLGHSIRLQAYQAEAAEKKRLLYVALTRAKDRLIISGSGSPVPGSFLHMIQQGVPEIDFNAVYGNSEYQIPVDLSILDQENTSTHSGTLSISVHIAPESDSNHISAPAIEIATQSTAPTQTLLLFDTVPYQRKDEYYSASQIMIAQRSTQEFIRRYVLGLNDQAQPDSENPAIPDHHDDTLPEELSNDSKHTPARLNGTVIHGILEHIPAWLRPDGQVDEDLLKESFHTVIRSLKDPDITIDAFDSGLQQCRRIANTQLLQRYNPQLANSKREYRLTMPVDQDFFVSVFDMLIQDEKGDYEVWDWKTNYCNSAEHMDELLQEYKVQLTLYLYICALCFPAQTTLKARLLFTRMARPGAADMEWSRTMILSREQALEQGKELMESLHTIRSLYGRTDE